MSNLVKYQLTSIAERSCAAGFITIMHRRLHAAGLIFDFLAGACCC